MMIRKGVVSMAMVAAVTASAASAFAASPETKLSLDPTVTMDATTEEAAAPASRRLLMYGLDKVGAASTLDNYGVNIYGWIEGSYTYNHKHINRLSSVTDGAGKVGPTGTLPFNHEAGDNFMGNQVAIRFEKLLTGDGSKFEVGGLVEVMYGQDGAAIHSNGLEYGNSGSDGDRLHPNYQFDIPQAYVDLAVGVKGLSIRIGKFYTTLGNEVINPDGNALFSHSYIFYSLPFTHTGVLASYVVNDQLSVKFGITRGWDQATEDSPSCYMDAIFQATYVVDKQWTVIFNASSGPENGGDNSHYRTAINPIVTYAATDALSFAAEALYIYDGNYTGSNPAAYGDQWGLALYVKYVVNDYVTINGRAEKFHNNTGAFDTTGNTNIYAFTLGATVTPMPTDPLGKNLKIRPEVRYDCGEDNIFTSSDGQGNAKGQLTFGVDIFYLF